MKYLAKTFTSTGQGLVKVMLGGLVSLSLTRLSGKINGGCSAHPVTSAMSWHTKKYQMRIENGMWLNF